MFWIIATITLYILGILLMYNFIAVSSETKNAFPVKNVTGCLVGSIFWPIWVFLMTFEVIIAWIVNVAINLAIFLWKFLRSRPESIF